MLDRLLLLAAFGCAFTGLAWMALIASGFAVAMTLTWKGRGMGGD